MRAIATGAAGLIGSHLVDRPRPEPSPHPEDPKMSEETSTTIAGPASSRPRSSGGAAAEAMPTVLSFDVEEHYRIEAAAGLDVAPRDGRTIDAGWPGDRLAARAARERATSGRRSSSSARSPRTTRGWSARSPRRGTRWPATAGTIAASSPWTPAGFREDVRRSKDALEQAGGTAVRRIPGADVQPRAQDRLGPGHPRGARLPVRLVDLPGAPRSLRHPGGAPGPVLAQGARRRDPGDPAGDGPCRRGQRPGRRRGLFPPAALADDEGGPLALARDPSAGATMLYFHPWEFDPDQPTARPWGGSAASGRTSASATAGPPGTAAGRASVPAGRRPGVASRRRTVQ